MKTKPPKSKLPPYWTGHIFRISLGVFFVLPLSAQTGEEEEDIHELSPFVVETSGDRGYISTNTTAGTSLNTALRNLPMGIEVINREFLEDIQAADMREGLAYTPGVFMQQFENASAANVGRSADYSPSQAVRASEFNDAVIIRGYTVPNQQRMGFRIGTIVPAYHLALGGITDSANTARQEVVRGPQSLLYGINVLSGIVNIVPRRPLPERRTNVTMAAGNQGYTRFVLDDTGPIIKDTLNFRVLGSFQESDDQIDFKESERQYYVGQLEWRITRRANLLLEVQYADAKVKGVGPRSFIDTGIGNDRDFGTPFRERYTFGRDYFDDRGFPNQRYFDPNVADHVTGEILGLEKDDLGRHVVPEGRALLVQRPGREYEFPDLGRFYNHSGPDTFRERKEFNFMGVLNVTPFDNVDVELGTLYAKVKDTEFNVAMSVFDDTTSTIYPSFPGTNPNAAPAAWQFNPEFDPDDPLGFGPGEFFLFPRHQENTPEVTHYVRKYAAYYWYERPTEAETWQFRTRLAYTFETDWFRNRVDGRHTVSGGLQYTQDEVSFINYSRNRLGDYYAWQTGVDATNNRFSEDPVIFRESIFDYTPIRYDPALGELAMIGALGRILDHDIDSHEDYIARSGHYDATLYYRGKYAVYHGRYFNERLHLIFGTRQDIYQVKERQFLRILDQDYLTDEWQGSRLMPQIDAFAGYGDAPYVWNPNLPDALNRNVEESVNRLRLTRPQGYVEKNFQPDDEKYRSHTFGMNYTFTDALSAYVLFSQGVFPNSGQRDGANQPFTAERSVNRELGLKFDFFAGRISGRIAYWEIDRENAVWHWYNAPNTRSWWGSSVPSASEPSSDFSPRRVDLFLEGMETGEFHRDAYDIRYGVSDHYVRAAYEQLGMELPPAHPRTGVPILSDFYEWGVANYSSHPASDPQIRGREFNFFFVNYHEMLAADEASGGNNPLRLAMDMAMRDEEHLNLGGNHIYRQGFSEPQQGYSHSSSSGRGRGALVGFEEEGRGVDGQIFLTPIPNYQIIFGFSHQEREVSSFKLVSGHFVDEFGNRSERQYTTEYDVWVQLLGAENFADPRDPSTLQSGAIHGLDLSFVPQTHLSVWNKYTFQEGPLERLEIGGGINWFSSVTTTTAVSDREMEMTPFATPDVPSRYQLDAYLGYRFNWQRTNWRVALNVYNILDDQGGETIATYVADDGRTEMRRTRQYYNPRSFRVSVGFTF